MKKTISTFLLVGFLTPLIGKAQGTTYLSNFGPSADVTTVASDSWRAVSFHTGTNVGGYELSSIQLLMASSVGKPGGFAAYLYDANGVVPGTSQGNLAGANPDAGGIYTYIAASLSLSPATRYFVVITAGTPVAVGAYQWSIQNTSQYSASNGWFLDGGFLSSPNGSSWSGYRPNPFQFAIHAMAVPEPPSLVLLSFSVLLLGANLRRRFA